jgi:ADP-ribose pyrophosphatase
MVDPGENVASTVRREFQEEAARGGLDENYVKRLFSNGYKLYESYVDDPRNTDNAWMETVAM